MAIEDSARKLGDDELLITRTFDAPVALVYRIWEDRDHMMRWWGPESFTCTHLDRDFRPGGAWRACIVSKTYGEKWMSGRMREIEKNKRIVFTFAWEEGSGETHETVVTVEFEEQDGKTIQTFHQAPFKSVASRDSHIQGWSSLLNSEKNYLDRFKNEARP